MPPVNAIAQFIPGCGLYKIDYSARFRSSASPSLTRTFSAPTNREKWTWAGWVRRTNPGGYDSLFCATNTNDSIGFSSADQLRVKTANVERLTTTQVFRDPCAWHFVVVRYDAANATAANRIIIEVNGALVTAFATDARSGVTTGQSTLNTAVSHSISFTGEYMDGGLADVCFVDGQSLDSSYFGYFTNGSVWVPKNPQVTAYGTNGFKLQFKNAAALGADTSGNSNGWTVNGLLSTDQMTDTPTSVFPTWNPLSYLGGSLSNAALLWTNTTNVSGVVGSTRPLPSTGKWYWEMVVTQPQTNTDNGSFGLTTTTVSTSAANAAMVGVSNTASNIGYVNTSGSGTASNTSAYSGSYTAGNVFGFAVDLDAGTMTITKDGAAYATLTGLSLSGKTWWPFASNDSTTSRTPLGMTVNFGQSTFSYSAPAGFKAVSTASMAIPTNRATLDPYKYFAAVTYTGTGAAQSVNLGFQPDLMWVKSRSNATNHWLMDTVRGISNGLSSNTTAAESVDATGITAITSTGFTLGAASTNAVNTSGNTYVVWGWKAGGAAVANTSGTITSQVSANPEAGFSVVTYTGTGANATVGHGLGTAPTMVIVKGRVATGGSGNWNVWHSGIAATEALLLNLTDAKATAAAAWNSATPTATTFSLGTAVDVNASTKSYVAYCFSDREGYLKTGKYTGNGSADGPFVYCGFRPRFVMIKCSSNAGNWYTFDCARDLYNPCNKDLLPNSSAVEGSITAAQYPVDILADGFKLRTSANNEMNGSGLTYIFLAIAEQPLVGQCTVPSNAR